MAEEVLQLVLKSQTSWIMYKELFSQKILIAFLSWLFLQTRNSSQYTEDSWETSFWALTGHILPLFQQCVCFTIYPAIAFSYIFCGIMQFRITVSPFSFLFGITPWENIVKAQNATHVYRSLCSHWCIQPKLILKCFVLRFWRCVSKLWLPARRNWSFRKQFASRFF